MEGVLVYAKELLQLFIYYSC